jgi:RNA polymerase sigma-70 factor (ECF subfamily)
LAGKQRERPFHSAAKNEDMIILLEAIQKLPPVRQELLILKFVEGESNAEIGRILGRSEGAIKSLYHRTLVSLKELLVDPPEIFEPFEASHDH